MNATPAANLLPVTPNPNAKVATPAPKKTKDAVPSNSATTLRAMTTSL
jgi:hypothetical protein